MLLLPGQGAQFVGMGLGLYGHHPVFTAAMDDVLIRWGTFGEQVHADWIRPTEASTDIHDIRRAQPLLFAIDHAMAKVVESWGVRPAALLGHSAGEVVAAVLTGVFDLDTAAALVAGGVGRAGDMPAGGMIAVAASTAELEGLLPRDVAVAAVNAARQTMLAGPTAPLAEAVGVLRAAGFAVRAIGSNRPFHSPAMATAAAANTAALARISLRPHDGRLWSGYTAGLLSQEHAVDPAFWGSQVMSTVRFGPALRALLEHGDALLVEAGPGRTLTSLAHRTPAVRSRRSLAFAMLPENLDGPEASLAALDDVARALRVEGHLLIDPRPTTNSTTIDRRSA
ncbi:acyltransferase domain-containing protein [Nocardia alba]|uniref:acyltransferase domain-containing protein n=1 Tax=Nocardia alba TaxID=225051 RepID=UPI001043210D|nr:acyltransferase domain-containing protein [Nocardia alba]